MAVNGGDSHRVAQTQVVKLVDVRVGGPGLVHFVHRQHHRLARLQKHVRHLLVGGGEPGLNVAQKDDDRGVLDGDLRLGAHEKQNFVVGAGLDAPRVHQVKPPPQPLAGGIEPVTSHAGGVLHDGEALPGELVEQHGLAHIRTAHNGYHRSHIFYPPKIASHRSNPS